MTCTVGPIGVWAQPDSRSPRTATPETPAVVQPRFLTERFPPVIGQSSVINRRGIAPSAASDLDSRWTLERDLVVQIAAFRGIPRWAAATAAWCTGGGTRRGAFAIATTLPRTAAFTAAARVKHGQFALESADHDLGRIALLALLVGPLAGLQRAFDVNLAALVQEALGDVTDPIVENHHPVPLGAFLALARLAIVPGFAGGERQIDDLGAVLRGAHLGILAEIAHQDHLVDAACHCFDPSPKGAA